MKTNFNQKYRDQKNLFIHNRGWKKITALLNPKSRSISRYNRGTTPFPRTNLPGEYTYSAQPKVLTKMNLTPFSHAHKNYITPFAILKHTIKW